MRRISTVVFLAAAGLVSGTNARAQFDDFEVNLTPEARAYCHVVQFPQGWSTQHFDAKAPQHLFFGSPNSDYEFRVEGVLSTKFLVRGFTEFVGTNYYTNNQYEVDLADAPAPVISVSRKVWDGAAVVPIVRKSNYLPRSEPKGDVLAFNGVHFTKSGTIFAQSYRGAALLSPDQAWLVLQSTTAGTKRGSAKVFFDYFSADTGHKLFTIEGTFSSANGGEPDDGVLTKTGWVTERYFIVPLGKIIERCLVCDFGGRNRERGTKK